MLRSKDARKSQGVVGINLHDISFYMVLGVMLAWVLHAPGGCAVVSLNIYVQWSLLTYNMVLGLVIHTAEFGFDTYATAEFVTQSLRWLGDGLLCSGRRQVVCSAPRCKHKVVVAEEVTSVVLCSALCIL